MNTNSNYDAVIVGAGPNGIAAAITLAQEGWKTLLIEGSDTLGGGMRSGERTLPGYVHDICSAVHPLANASAFFRQLDLEKYGLRWIHSPVEVAHPLDGGQAILAYRSLDDTGQQLGADGDAYKRLMQPFVNNYTALLDDLHGPLPLPPKHPLLTARFGLKGVQPAVGFAKRSFREMYARSLFAGMGAHAILPLDQPGTAAAGILLGMTLHAVGWPLAEGGSQSIADALLNLYYSLGGELVSGWKINSLDELPESRAVLLNLAPKSLLEIAGDKFPNRYRRKLNKYRYGAGIFKIDYALSEPIPWENQECARAITVHIGGTLQEIRQSELAMARSEHAERPFVLLSQPTLFDPGRAPAGKHIAWAYCHVPNGSKVDMTSRIEDQIERFAPGFRECILKRHTTNSEQLESYDPNFVGGDISSGQQDLIQQFARPVASLQPYRTPIKGVYLCSSATPPGGGVHGMCGYRAAQLVLKDTARA